MFFPMQDKEYFDVLLISLDAEIIQESLPLVYYESYWDLTIFKFHLSLLFNFNFYSSHERIHLALNTRNTNFFPKEHKSVDFLIFPGSVNPKKV